MSRYINITLFLFSLNLYLTHLFPLLALEISEEGIRILVTGLYISTVGEVLKVLNKINYQQPDLIQRQVRKISGIKDYFIFLPVFVVASVGLTVP